ncbi:MAG: DUF4012 domain-containing protein [Candidatus Magasanikbacteria bacterium]|nr:DUF4012 domain-containing protein [Candidatus Magasanikbacteria bacterium]
MIHHQKPRKWPWVLLAIFILVAGSVWFAYTWLTQLSPENILNSEFVKKYVADELGEEKAELFSQLPELMGFSEPKTYLFLFLNNTELRPGGGFIGSYATIRMDKGNMEILAMEGTEGIDRNAPDSFKPKPPQILLDHLGVDRWYFRDSNWSPDFAVSAQKSLELYAGENGVASSDIDAVLGITTTVLEELMKITGPFEIQGINFSADTVIEKLEYEVEYGYDDKGLHFFERKQIIKPFMRALMDHLKSDVFKNMSAYQDVFTTLTHEKHIMVYARDPGVQKIVVANNLSGEMNSTSGDYLMWVDANLAALKTDHALTRNLTYVINRHEADERYASPYYIAGVTMKYTHAGVFDWRTTRYRTYARVFVPQGSELISTAGSMRWDRTTDSGKIDSGVENGKQWFGTFIAIEPGKVGKLTFEYRLPDSVATIIEQNQYSLTVQKQLGTIAHGLTFDLNFDKTIRSAKPAEEQKHWGDMKYQLVTDLRVDREFMVSL